MFCKHSWKFLSETTTTSTLDQLHSLGYTAEVESVTAMLDLTQKKLVQLVTCEKCGKIKRFVEII